MGMKEIGYEFLSGVSEFAASSHAFPTYVGGLRGSTSVTDMSLIKDLSFKAGALCSAVAMGACIYESHNFIMLPLVTNLASGVYEGVRHFRSKNKKNVGSLDSKVEN